VWTQGDGRRYIKQGTRFVGEEVFPIYDETDVIRFVDRETYLRLTAPRTREKQIEHYISILRAAGYEVIEAGLAKEMIQAHRLVSMLRARTRIDKT
jgi:hypothetical protein